MPWSRVSADSCLIYDEEGSWIATCATPGIASAIVRLSESSTSFSTTRKFTEQVDSLIDITDKHLAGICSSCLRGDHSAHDTSAYNLGCQSSETPDPCNCNWQAVNNMPCVAVPIVADGWTNHL